MPQLCVYCLFCCQALRSNQRIDGLYLYINTSSPGLLTSRQKQRMSEDASTLAKPCLGEATSGQERHHWVV